MSDFYSIRSRIIRIVFAAAFLLIIVQLFNLQVLSNKYGRMAEDQAIYRKVVYPSRGLVFDRRKKIMIDNTTLSDLVVVPSQLRGTDTQLVCRVLGIDTAEFRKRVITAIIKNGRYQPSVFEGLLDNVKHARLAENLYKIQPGFDLVERPIRKYPYPVGAHVFGYIAEVDTAFLRRHDGEGYRQGDYAGWTGMERAYEKVLMGQRGIQYWLRDKMNKPTQPYQQGKFDTAAIAGSDLYSSIDIDLQNLGEKLLKGKMGSVVAIDPRTGGILAMVSAPGYDPNLLTGSQRRRQFSEMFLDPRKPMLNRAITGEYSPGSTFKTLQGLVALQEGVITTDYGYPCRGGYYACGRRMGCHGAGHAPNLERAIAVSCNAYFADVFRKIVDNPKYPNVDTGLAVWDRYMYSFGLGHPLGIDIPGERRGNIPTPKYYQKIFGPKWNSCNVVSISIGQGEVLSTVTQLSNAIAMIANKGWYYTPHVVDSIAGGDRFGLLKPFQTRIEALNIPDSMFESVHSGMEDVMKPGGTGWRLAVDGIRICGKTGTVENYYKGKKQKDHSFFAAFAPRENPQIAIACIVENAGFGATVAGPVVSLMIEQYMHDSISAKRQSWIERYSSMTIIPPRINDEIQLRDSINREKDRVKAQKKLMDEIKREAGLEEDPDAEIINRKQPEKPASDTGKNKQQGLPATVPAYLLLAATTATRRRPNQQNRRTP